jgi:hypothetical protein
MAGLGYRTFSSGAVLTASQVQGYLQDQTVMRFASASARDAALTPAEGMVCYLNDSSVMLAYDGSNWVVVPVANTYIIPTGGYSVASPTAALQNIYAASGSGFVLAASTLYKVRGVLRVSWTNGLTTSQPSFQMTYSGTSASSQFLNKYVYNSTGFTFASSNAPAGEMYTSSQAVNVPFYTSLTHVSGNFYNTVEFEGFIRTTTSGTLTPQWGFTSNATISSVAAQANSFYEVIPVGSATATNVGTFV